MRRFSGIKPLPFTSDTHTQPPLLLGHRGCMGQGYPEENTIAAFDFAISHGAEGIECDLHATLDGTLVIHHNATFLSHGREYAIASVDIPFLNREAPYIPTVDSLMERYVSQQPQCFNLEVKSRGAALLLLKRLPYYIETYGWQKEKIIISSFRHRWLSLFHKQDPLIRLGTLCTRRMRHHTPDSIIHTLGFVPFAIHPPARLLNDKYVSACKRHGVEIVVWNVDHPHGRKPLPPLSQYIDWEVYALITDFPDQWSQRLKNR